MRKLVFGIIIFSLITGGLLIVPAIAQEQKGLSYDSPVEGEITDEAPSQAWKLSAQGADRISVYVERTSGNLIPSVDIIDPAGQTMATSDGADETGAVAQIENFTLFGAGSYRIQVGRLNGMGGVTTGTFRLTVHLHASGADHPNNLTTVGSLELDTPVTGEITADHWQHIYILKGDEGDTIDFSASRISGSLFPIVEFYDDSGTLLSESYLAGTYDFIYAERVDLPYTGEYTLIMTRDEGYEGESIGEYNLMVNLISSGENSPRLEGTAGEISYGETVTGEVTNTRWYQAWQLTAPSADMIRIIVTRTDGTLLPAIYLLDSNNEVLNTGYYNETGTQATIWGTELPGEGTYTIRVGRAGWQDGYTTGNYELRVQVLSTAQDNPILQTVYGNLELDTPVTGTITNAQWQNHWTFEATENPIHIQVMRTDGTLFPALGILDSTGNQLDGSYTEDDGEAAFLEEVYLEPGTYTLVVERADGYWGVTEGSYELTLTVATP